MFCLDPLLPPKWCELCRTEENLSKCGGCKVILYCSHEHQAAHRSEHKVLCEDIVAAQYKLAKAYEDLHGFRFVWPRNVGVPVIPEVPEGLLPEHTRPYRLALLETVTTTARAHRPLAIELAVDGLMEMLRINHADELGAWMMIPNFLLRLGRDQECYDYIKFWRLQQLASTSHPPEKEGFLPLKDEDMLEPIDIWWNSQPVSLSLVVPLTLIKIRMLVKVLYLEDLKSAGRREKAGELPPSFYELTACFLKRTDIRTQEDQGPLISKMHDQIERCIKLVDMTNEHFWPALLNPTTITGQYNPEHWSPDPYIPGSLAEAHQIWGYNYTSWGEDPLAEEALTSFRRV